jgi:hypothetical protein
MPLTDDEIRALLEKSRYEPFYGIRRHQAHELCTRLLSAEAKNRAKSKVFCAMLSTGVCDQNERAEKAIQERDEARAKIAELENIDALEAKIAPIIREAEERGYERGIREAANHRELYGLSSIRIAILSLLEPTLQKPEA